MIQNSIALFCLTGALLCLCRNGGLLGVMNILLQASNTEGFTRLQQTIGLIVVNIATFAAIFIFTLKTISDVRKTLKDTKKTAKEILEGKEELVQSKDEIIKASDRNFNAIQANTNLTQNQAIEMQKHLIDRIRRELIPMSQRIAKVESHLFTDEDASSAPTQVWRKDDDSNS